MDELLLDAGLTPVVTGILLPNLDM